MRATIPKPGNGNGHGVGRDLWRFVRQVIVALNFYLVYLVVEVYTWLTLPLYRYMQQPWRVLEASAAQRTRPLCADNPELGYASAKQTASAKHLIQNVETIDDLVKLICLWRKPLENALGQRYVMNPIGWPMPGVKKQSKGKKDDTIVLTDYVWLNYRKLLQRRQWLACGLMQNGLNRGDKIIFFCETCLEFLLMQLAVAHMGAVLVCVPVLTDSDYFALVLGQTRAKFIFVSSTLIFKMCRVLHRHKVSDVTIIYIERFESIYFMTSELCNYHQGNQFKCLSFVEECGRNANHCECSPLPKKAVAFIYYTSGATGMPKAMQITSTQMISRVRSLVASFDWLTPSEHIYAAIMSQAHVFEITFELMCLSLGIRIGFASPNTMIKPNLVLAADDACDLSLLQPTLLNVKPKLLEHLFNQIEAKLKASLMWEAFKHLINYKVYWTKRGYQTPILNSLVCRRIQSSLGGHLNTIMVTGGSLEGDRHAFLKAALNVRLLQGYGCIETIGNVLCMDKDDLAVGRCGHPMNNVLVRLVDYDLGGYTTADLPCPRGELQVDVPDDWQGYYRLANVHNSFHFDGDRIWCRTGDIFEMHNNGTFKFIERREDIAAQVQKQMFVNSSYLKCLNDP